MSEASSHRTMHLSWVICGAGGALLTTMIFSDAAFAYRPFDGTDAAVAEPGEREIEFQPAGVSGSNGQRTLFRWALGGPLHQ